MIGVCRRCGCTEENPCLITSDGTVVGPELRAELLETIEPTALDAVLGELAEDGYGMCGWAEPDLCTACAAQPEARP